MVEEGDKQQKNGDRRARKEGNEERTRVKDDA